MRRAGLAFLVLTLGVTGAALAANSGLPGTKTKADRAAWRKILHWPAQCETDWNTGSFGSGIAVWRTPTPKLFVQVTCYVAAYQATFHLYLVDANRHATGPLALTTYIDPGSGKPKVTHDTLILGSAGFDPKTGIFTVEDKGRGLGDCGIYTVAKLTGDRLVTTEVRARLKCDGKPPYDPTRWPKLPIPKP